MGARPRRRPERGSKNGAKKAKKDGTPAPRFAKDIRPLFQSRDVEHMKSVAGFDLSRVEDVRKNATKIFFRLSTKMMPPERPWPNSRIARFKQWMDGGMKP